MSKSKFKLEDLEEGAIHGVLTHFVKNIPVGYRFQFDRCYRNGFLDFFRAGFENGNLTDVVTPYFTEEMMNSQIHDLGYSVFCYLIQYGGQLSIFAHGKKEKIAPNYISGVERIAHEVFRFAHDARPLPDFSRPDLIRMRYRAQSRIVQVKSKLN